MSKDYYVTEKQNYNINLSTEQYLRSLDCDNFTGLFL